MLTEIPFWFRNSDLRRENYKELYSVFNASSDPELTRVTPLPFEKTSSTRWLVRGKVMYNLLVNWHELTAYFVSAELAPQNYGSKCKARLIKEML